MALIDKFGRVHKYLRISLTESCNLRCTYCMPEETVFKKEANYLSPGEIEKYLDVFVNELGISKIRLTGGEPTLRSDFSEILAAFAPYKGKIQMGITTNGVLLSKYLPKLVENGFSLVNISMDTLDRDKFPLISNRNALYWDRAKTGFDLSRELLLAGEIKKLKINTVVMNRMNSDEICDFVLLTQNLDIEVRFIELMPFAGNSYSDKLFLAKSDILDIIEKRFGKIDSSPDLTSSSSVGGNLYRIPSFVGSFGIISSMTDSFCGSCDRLRLTSTGSLRNCLFSNDDTEKKLSGKDRIEMKELIKESVEEKFASYGGKKGPADLHAQSSKTRPMIQIGG